MHSIRSRSIILTVIAISVSITVVTLISAFTIASQGHERVEQTLSLSCQTGKNNLDYYLKGVEQSVNTISSLVDSHLDSIKDEEFKEKLPIHINEARNIFYESANNTSGVLTYYYRMDPTITASTGEAGFWYTNLDGKGFVEHEVTDITNDQFECRWFYGPKNSGKPIWLSPYLTDNLDQYVISYNVPVYREGAFVGVAGIEISYHTLGQQIERIKVLNSGYAFIVENANGSIIYHPKLDILSMKEADRPKIPDDFLSAFKKGDHHIQYSFEGVNKHCCVLGLSNGMSIVVTVPASEVNATWINFLNIIVSSAAVIIVVFAAITILYTRRLTKPLKELTKAAEKINEGDYDIDLSYKRDDEIGTLTETVRRLIKHLDGYISDLNSLAYADALTSVENKSAFDAALGEIEGKLYNKNETLEFGIAIFDCDNLKTINDKYGHDKGNVYLKNSSHLIERTFHNSHVYRIGGDEFAVILLGEDYNNREQLKEDFLTKSKEICSFAKEPWEEIHVSIGIAIYDPIVDKTAEDVMIHADHLMYEHKRERKKQNK